MWILSPLLSGTVCKICNYLCWADSERVLLLNAILGDKVIKQVTVWECLYLERYKSKSAETHCSAETPVHSNVALRCLKYVWRIFGNKRVEAKLICALTCEKTPFVSILLSNTLLFIFAQILKRGCGVNDRDGLTDMSLLHYCCKAGAQGIG